MEGSTLAVLVFIILRSIKAGQASKGSAGTQKKSAEAQGHDMNGISSREELSKSTDLVM